MLATPVSGSRTRTWHTAAPALAASMHAAAICSGVTGTAGFFFTVGAEPVTAQGSIVLRGAIETGILGRGHHFEPRLSSSPSLAGRAPPWASSRDGTGASTH